MFHRHKAQQLYACPVDGGAIVLDLEAEKYYALQRPPTSQNTDTTYFISRGYIVQRDLIDVEKIQGLEDLTPQLPSVGPRHIYAFALSVVAVSITNRIGGMKAVIRHIARQKHRHEALLLPASSPALSRLLHAFLRLRPWVYSARDHCLFDSLVLATYLIRLHHDARVIVGVRTHPFGAHAWIQSGDCVIGDLPEQVKLFSPILVL
jgi:Transglutaminase-like superfamily